YLILVYFYPLVLVSKARPSYRPSDSDRFRCPIFAYKPRRGLKSIAMLSRIKENLRVALGDNTFKKICFSTSDDVHFH
ncbi:unnamed protein product, partial [Psylliodes chrysocephalus]